MALNANKSKNGSNFDRVIMEPGTYPARLVNVIDLGLQAQRPFQGKEKPNAYEIMLTYEFVDEFMKDEDGNDIPDKPRWLSESFPAYSLDADLAKSTKRYKAIDPSMAAEGDWTALLGNPVLVTVINNVNSKTGKVYENIASVASMRTKDAANTPELINTPVFFDLDAPDIDAFKSLPEWIQKKIKGNLEFPGSKLEAMLPKDGESKTKTVMSDSDEEPEDLDDENPY